MGGYDGFVFGVGDGVGLVFLPAVDEVEDSDVVVGAEFFGVGECHFGVEPVAFAVVVVVA